MPSRQLTILYCIISMWLHVSTNYMVILRPSCTLNQIYKRKFHFESEWNLLQCAFRYSLKIVSWQEVCVCECACVSVRVCVCVYTVLHSYWYLAGFRILSVCAGYQKATHPSCQLTTTYILPAITHLHTKQTALLPKTVANNKDQLYTSALLLKLKTVSTCTL